MKKLFRVLLNVLKYLSVYWIVQTLFSFVLMIFHITEVLSEGNRAAYSFDMLIQETQSWFREGSCIWVIVSGTAALLIYMVLFKEQMRALGPFINTGKRCVTRAMAVLTAAICMSIAISVFTGMICRIVGNSGSLDTGNWVLSGENLILVIAGAGIIGPLFEEILFRGLILQQLKKCMNTGVAVVVQSVLFALLHFNTVQSFWAFLFGIVSAVIYIWTGSIFCSVILHIMYNITGIIIERHYFIASDSTMAAVSTAAAILAASSLLYLKAMRNEVAE